MTLEVILIIIGIFTINAMYFSLMKSRMKTQLTEEGREIINTLLSTYYSQMKRDVDDHLDNMKKRSMELQKFAENIDYKNKINEQNFFDHLQKWDRTVSFNEELLLVNKQICAAMETQAKQTTKLLKEVASKK